ncbi:hypothetical protein F2P81_026225 [Scophthalmus maximus]|uniref:Uncharacterized protein n=1 Tax=Scophthalmus maximus TaxID=52904 RepID=A0A6A4RI39_SCOMX|nr:hypothetical protein F2P81_026225 [Scophthalmus maximus]
MQIAFECHTSKISRPDKKKKEKEFVIFRPFGSQLASDVECGCEAASPRAAVASDGVDPRRSQSAFRKGTGPPESAMTRRTHTTGVNFLPLLTRPEEIVSEAISVMTTSHFVKVERSSARERRFFDK